MKNTMKKMTALMIAFLAVGCGPVNNDAKSEPSNEPTSTAKSEQSVSSKEGEKSSSQGGGTTSQQTGGHKYATTWSYDDEYHWHACTEKDCRAVSDYGEHQFGEWTTVDPSTLEGAARYAYEKPQIKKCATCGYYQIKGTPR